MPHIRWGRVLSLTLFALITFTLLLTSGSSWLFHRAVVWPRCNPLRPVSGILQPSIANTIVGHDGIQLDVHYYPGTNNAAIIVLGGTGGVSVLTEHQARFLNVAGYGVLLVDMRPCAAPPMPQTVGFRESRDFSALATYLIDVQSIDAGRVGALGWSMGGATALLGAAQTGAIGAVVAEGNFHNYGELLHPPEGGLLDGLLTIPLVWFFERATAIDPYAISPRDALAEIAPRPVFLIYGEHELSPATHAMLAQAADVWIVPGGTHGGNYALFPEEYPARILAFFDRYLRGE
jgi:dienelactone hydrolase